MLLQGCYSNSAAGGTGSHVEKQKTRFSTCIKKRIFSIVAQLYTSRTILWMI